MPKKVQPFYITLPKPVQDKLDMWFGEDYILLQAWYDSIKPSSANTFWTVVLSDNRIFFIRLFTFDGTNWVLSQDNKVGVLGDNIELISLP